MNVSLLRHFREPLIDRGFAFLQATGLHHKLAPWTRGLGSILMFHHVRPAPVNDFAPNRLLEITPEFLDEILTKVVAAGFDIVSLDEAVARIGQADLLKEQVQRPFVVLTFDDAYRDNRVHALPILVKHQAPFTLFVTSGFAEGTARLWWVELGRAIERLDHLQIVIAGRSLDLPAHTNAQKKVAYDTIYWRLRPLHDVDILAATASLCAQASLSPTEIVRSLCMNWDELRLMAKEPLCSIGAHSKTHALLARHEDAVVEDELLASRQLIEQELSVQVRNLAYPLGDRQSAGQREFALAKRLGYASAVTTRPGMLFPNHAEHLTALPRMSVNGLWSDWSYLDILLTGLPFVLWNQGRRVIVD
ncbi:MAG: polysaccharide deacetylase [Alphaproteobacteria bacterium]|nr:polysaccharide deacetylase [Alphaproteobacteria bacterium]